MAIINESKGCKLTEQERLEMARKESLRGLMGDDFVQEYPWEV